MNDIPTLLRLHFDKLIKCKVYIAVITIDMFKITKYA